MSNVHITDDHYHVDCMTNFMSPNSIAAAENVSKVNVNEDPALIVIVLQKKLVKDKTRLWNSVHLHHLRRKILC